MSVRLPDVRLEGGVFTVEDGRPVFIDDHGTRHYDKGLSMQQLFMAGMQFQKAKDSTTIEEKKRRVVQLSGELEKTRQAAATNFEFGAKLQLAHDKKLLEEASERAYSKGRADQWREDAAKVKQAYIRGRSEQDGLAHELIVKFSLENRSLRQRLTSLSGQLERSQRVIDLNLSPRASRRESPLLEMKKRESSDELPNDRDVLDDDVEDEETKTPASSIAEQLPEDRKKDFNEVVELEEKQALASSSSKDHPLVAEGSSTKSVDPMKLSQNDRIQWICNKLKENPYYPVPEWFQDDLLSCLIDLCLNYQQGLPKVLDYLEAFYQLPDEVNLNRFFTMRVRKREGMVLGAIRKVLVNRKKYSSYRLLLIGMRADGNLQKYKPLKTAIYRHLETLYHSIESCLEDGQVNLAAGIVKDYVRAFRKGQDPENVVSALESLSSSSEAAYLARDLMIDLLRKDAALFPLLKVVVSNIKKKYEADSKRNITDIFHKLLRINVERSLLVNEFGMELAVSCQNGPLPGEFLSPDLMKFWTERREDETCNQAFWVCLANCSIEDEELVRTCTSSISEHLTSETFPEEIPGRQLVISYLNICQGWSKHALKLRLMSIGSPLAILWDKVKADATPEERKAFVVSLQKGSALYWNDPNQYINYLWTLLHDVSENGKQWDVSPQFLFQLFHQITVVRKDTSPEIKKRLADFAISFWNLASYARPDFRQTIMGPNAQMFFDTFIMCLEGTEHAEKIPVARKKYFQRKMHLRFLSILYKAGQSVQIALPEHFWIEIRRALNEEMKVKPVKEYPTIEEEKLYYVQMMGFIRVLIVRKYLEQVDTVNLKHLAQIERAANYFLTGFEDALISDQDVKKHVKDFFELVYRPKENLHILCEKAAAKATMELPETFWKDVEEEMYQDVDSLVHTSKCAIDQALLVVRSRNLLVRKLIEHLQPVTEDVMMEIETVTTGFATKLEDLYENENALIQLKLEFWKTLCRAAFTSNAASAWEHFSYHTLDLFIQDFFKAESFDVSEWTKMAVLCTKSSDEHTESVTVQMIVNHIVSYELTQEELSDILLEIASAYFEAGKIDQYIFFLNDEKDRFTSEQIEPWIKKLDGILLSDRDVVEAVVKLRLHFQSK